jgi:Family of unknown function (DUF5681)
MSGNFLESKMSETERENAANYRKPPVDTRFKKGESRKSRGRPEKNLPALLAAALKEKVTVTENGKRRQVTKREAVIAQLVVVSKKVVQSIRQGFLLERVWPQRRAAARTLRAGCRRSPLAILAPTRRYGRWWTQVGTKQRSLRSNQATGI